MVVRKHALEISLDLVSAPGRALAWPGTRQSQCWCMGGPMEGRRQGAEEGSRPLSPYAGPVFVLGLDAGFRGSL